MHGEWQDRRTLGSAAPYSDALFHAARASLFDRVGREAEGIENARLALAIMRGAPSHYVPPEVAAVNHEPAVIYPLILPVPRKAGGADYDWALVCWI